MLLEIPAVLNRDEVAAVRRALDAADWTDGRVTSGAQAALVKRNEQVPEGHPVAREWGDRILAKLEQTPLFISAALPLKVYPPMFNRYAGGGTFGTHIDTAIRSVPHTPHRVRSDLSATLFLSDPDEYDGGELMVDDAFGTHAVKLPAGHMVLYPGGSLHYVEPVTRGTRLGSFFWVQSMVREDAARTLLFDLDAGIQRVTPRMHGDPALMQLLGVYHNLLRRWADT